VEFFIIPDCVIRQAIAEVHACADSKEAFVRGFVATWNKMTNLDRYDLA
jgi:catalase-peroxidase